MTEKETQRRIADLRNLVEVQGQEGNYDISEYMTGLFNGLELALAMFESREPKFKPIPKQPIKKPSPSPEQRA